MRAFQQRIKKINKFFDVDYFDLSYSQLYIVSPRFLAELSKPDYQCEQLWDHHRRSMSFICFSFEIDLFRGPRDYRAES